MSSGIVADPDVAVIACAGAANDALPTIKPANMQSATTKRMRVFEVTLDLCTGACAGQFFDLTDYLPLVQRLLYRGRGPKADRPLTADFVEKGDFRVRSRLSKQQAISASFDTEELINSSRTR